MPNRHLAPTSKTQLITKPKTGTDIVEFRKVATPWVTFIAEQPNDIAGQNADPDGTIEDSVDISDPSYDEKKTRTIEVQYAEEDHLEPPIHVNTLDESEDQNSENQASTAQSNNSEPSGETLEDQPKNSDPAEAAALVDMSEIYEPKEDETEHES